MRSPPPPRVLAAWLVPFALYAFVLPVVTMLVVLAASGAYGYSFSSFSLAPLLLSVLYWFSRFGDVDRSTGSAGSIEFELATPRTTFNYGPSDRSNEDRRASTGGRVVSPYSLYFFGLFLASLLVYLGVVP